MAAGCRNHEDHEPGTRSGRRCADCRLWPRAQRCGRYVSGHCPSYIRRSAEKSRTGRRHRACRFPGAGARRRRSWCTRPRPGDTRRIPQAPRHRDARDDTDGQGQPRRRRGHCCRNAAAGRRRPRRDGADVQGAGGIGTKPHIAGGICQRSAGCRGRYAMKLESPLLSAVPGLSHAFFNREGGVSRGVYAGLNGGIGSNDDPAKVVENRRRMAQQLGVRPQHLLTAYQIHSPDAVVASAPWDTASRPRADAIVTRTEGLAIGITAADCGPILLVDPNTRVIGAAHAGWRGALTGIVESTVEAMEKLGAKRVNIVAAIGPLIRQHSYEVGNEFVERFVETDAENALLFLPAARKGHAMFDLAGFIRKRLQGAGVLIIDDVGVDTYSDEQFFSYRRSVHRKEPDYGRHVHEIALES